MQHQQRRPSFFNMQFELQAARLHCSTEEIRKVFRALDKKQRGGVTAKELCAIMKKLGSALDETEARNIVGEADKKGTGMLTEDDFVSFMHQRAADFTGQLREAFQEMDTNKTGSLTPSQLRAGFARLGMTFSNQEFREMLAVVHLGSSGEISWEEFLSAMQ